MRYIKLFFAVGLTITTVISYAQETQEDKEKKKWGEEGEIAKVEIEIVKEKQIELRKANRNFEKVPPRPAEPIKPEITYEFKNLNFTTSEYNPSIRPLRLQQDPKEKLFGNYISGGFGNFSSPLLEGYFTNKRSKEKFYGAKFFHQSFGSGPVDKSNSSSGNTELTLFGKRFGKYASVGGALNFQNFRNRFYGYAPGTQTEAERQGYSIVSLEGTVENPKSADFNYKLTGGFSYLDDKFSATESEVHLGLKSDYNFSEESKFLIGGDYYLIARKDELIEAKPRHLLKVQPAYQFFLIENLTFSAGLNVALENDTIGSTKPFHLYPNVRAEYPLSKSVEVYAALTGDVDKVSLHTLARENAWLDANINIFNTNRTLELLGGLKGKLGNKVSFGAGFSMANLKDLYFYKNEITAREKFEVVYDKGNVQRTNLFGEMSFSQADKILISFRGDLYGYSTDKVEAAWHKPTYRVTFNSSFNIVDKFVINANIITQGGAKAFNVDNNSVVTIASAVDIGARLNYLVSPRFSIFIKGSNLLANEYQVYLNYPVRGLQVLGGLTYVF